MNFGFTQNPISDYSTYWLDVGHGYKESFGVSTITNPTQLKGYITQRKIVNIFINGTLSNAAFIIKYRQTRVEFEYNGDITKFTQPILLQLEIEK